MRKFNDIPSAVERATNSYKRQIERTSRQLSGSAKLVPVEVAWKIQAGESKQLFEKNPFLLTQSEAVLFSTDFFDEFETDSEFGCVPAL